MLWKQYITYLKTGNKNKGVWNFPSKFLISILKDNNISFTIGSDAHKPNEINMDIQTMLKIVKDIGIEKIGYYQNRNIIHVDIDKCITEENK